jgi:predicted nuclease of predicted toxin-antitoxin system
MFRLLLDESLPLRAAGLLRGRGMDAIHAREAGLAAESDPAILKFAAAERRICVTVDQDFHRLLAGNSATAPSVILIRAQNLDYEETAELIGRTLAQAGSPLETGAAVTVTRRGLRLRLLPLK